MDDQGALLVDNYRQTKPLNGRAVIYSKQWAVIQLTFTSFEPRDLIENPPIEINRQGGDPTDMKMPEIVRKLRDLLKLLKAGSNSKSEIIRKISDLLESLKAGLNPNSEILIMIENLLKILNRRRIENKGDWGTIYSNVIIKYIKN